MSGDRAPVEYVIRRRSDGRFALYVLTGATVWKSEADAEAAAADNAERTGRKAVVHRWPL